MQSSGVILLNKPVNISSNAAVNKVKFLLGAKKAGHLGTLDPLASGVLPVTFGKATRLFDYFLTKNKTYKATFVFGFQTDTLDCEGKVLDVDNKQIKNRDIENVINKFIGVIEQFPPKFSALKVNGKKAYDLARNGQEVELASRKIQIFDIRFKKIEDIEKIEENLNFFIKENKDDNVANSIDKIKSCFYENSYEFEIECSAGTYIRSLVRDIATAMQTYGTMAWLVRTKCGKFDISNAFTFQQIENNQYKVLSIDEVVDLEKIEITSEDCKKLLCGQTVKIVEFKGIRKLYSNGELIGLASVENGKLKINTFLKEE